MPTDDLARLRKLPRQILLAIAAFAAATLCGVGWEIHGDLERERTASERVLQSQATAVAEHLAVTLQEAEGELERLAPDIERAGGPAALDEERIQRLMFERTEQYAQVGSILVVNAHGTLVANSLQVPVPRVSLADRDYFAFHRDNPGVGHFIGRPVRNRLNGRWRFFITRRLSLADGRFAGVLGVALDPGYYDTFYRSIEISRRARIALIRTDGVVLVASDEELLGRDVSGEPLFTTHLADAPRGVYGALGSALGPDRTVAYEELRARPIVAVVSLPSADLLDAFWRDTLWKLVAVVVAFAAIGVVTAGLLRRVRDLEAALVARRALEHEVSRASKLESLGVLAGGIAHDFNNLLAAILSGVEVAREALPASSEGAAALADSSAAARRATALTRQLLAFSKGGTPVRETTAVAELVRESARFVVHGSRSILRLELATDLRDADVDPGQISQVVQNLVINAEQAMPSGGAIAVAARNVQVRAPEEGPGGTLLPGDYVEISVADEGVGIPRENLERLFDPFFTTKPDGHGLGLTTVHAIVRRHGGAIRVRSEPGRGAQFVVLPPAAEAGATADERARAAAPEPLPPGLRVLVLDDQADVRRGVVRMLHELGCEAEECADGGEAVERYREALAAGRRLDVVIADVTIPGGMSGPDAARAIRAIDPAARILVSSGYSDIPVAGDPARHGADAYVPKPYTLDELRSALARALRVRAA